MARIKIDRNNFSLGVLNKSIQGNIDLEKYDNALDECINFQINHAGGVSKRGGTIFVDSIGIIEGETILRTFCYDADNTYMLLFANGFIKVYDRSYTILQTINIPNLDVSEIKQYDFFQEGNYFYFLTKTFGLCRIKREQDGDTIRFVFESNLSFNNEGLTFCNTYPIAVKPDKDNGDGIIFTVVNAEHPDTHPDYQYLPYFVNDNDLNKYLILTYIFEDTTVAIYFIKITNIEWPNGRDRYPVITGNIDRKKCQNPEPLNPEDPNNKDVKLPSLDSNYRWQIAGFSDPERGRPQLCSMHEGRLFLSKTTQYPTGLWGSSLLYDDVLDFYAGARSVDGLQYKIKLERSHEIRWITAISKMFIGSSDGVYIAGAATANEEAITPSNFRSRLLSNIGVGKLKPIKGMDAVFFVDSSEKNVHEIVYSGDVGMYQVNDISLLSNDLTQSGITCHAWQQQPIKTYWCAVNEGFLCSLTYLKNNGIFAWAKHELGGNNVSIEDIAVLQHDKTDYLWMITRREIKGAIRRYLEVLTPPFNSILQDEFKQNYLDFSSSYEIKFTISDIQKSVLSMIDFSRLPDKEAKLISNLHHYQNNSMYMLERRIDQTSNVPIIDFYKTKDYDDKSQLAIILKKYTFENGNLVEYLPSRHDTILNVTTVATRLASIKYVDYVYDVNGNVIYTRIYLDTVVAVSFLDINNDIIYFFDSGLLDAGGREIDIDAHIQHPIGYSIFVIKNNTTPNIPGSCYIEIGITRKKANYRLSPDASIYAYINGYGITASGDTVVTLSAEDNAIFDDDTVNNFLGQEIYINKVFGMTEINGERLLVQRVNTELNPAGLITKIHLHLGLIYKEDVEITYDSHTYSAYNNLIPRNGNVYLYFEEFTLENRILIGETVSVCADGNYIGETKVERTDKGEPYISLENTCMHCTIGFKYKSKLVTLNPSKGSLINSVVGSKGYTRKIYFLVKDSIGGKYKIGNAGDFYKFAYDGLLSNKLNYPSILKSGLISANTLNATEKYNNKITIEHDEPTCFNLLSVTQDVQIND